MIALKRFPDWPQRLYRAIQDRDGRRHAWGSIDCCLYSADLILAVTGEDLAKGLRRKYRSEAGAKRVMAANGWPDLVALGDHFLPRHGEGERLRRGDAVLREGLAGPFMGIVVQRGIIGPGPDRPVILPAQHIIASWKVG